MMHNMRDNRGVYTISLAISISSVHFWFQFILINMSNPRTRMRFWPTSINSAVKCQQSPHMTLKQESVGVLTPSANHSHVIGIVLDCKINAPILSKMRFLFILFFFKSILHLSTGRLMALLGGEENNSWQSVYRSCAMKWVLKE